MVRHTKQTRSHSTRPLSKGMYADVWDVKRDIVLLTTRLASERAALETWQRRLTLASSGAQEGPGASQLAQLRQETAACHAMVLEIERRVADARHLLRQILARQDAK